MSLSNHKKSIALDNMVASYNASNPEQPLPGKTMVGCIVVLQIVAELSLPTGEVQSPDSYWWSNHQEVVAKKVSGLNEIFPIPVNAVMAAVKELYLRRYYVAFPRTTADFSNLLGNGDMGDGVGDMFTNCTTLGDYFHNVTIAEILRDAIK